MRQAKLSPTYRSEKGSVEPRAADTTAQARAGALQFLECLATEVSGGVVDLPCFPEVVIRIRKALADPRTTPERMVTIVGAEPRLAAKLLQTANSAAFNSTGRPLTDLRAAITRLGQQLVQSAAMAFAVKQIKDQESLRSIAHLLSELWTESITVASLARVISRRTKISPDEAFLTGLLHGIGQLYILVRATGHVETGIENQTFIELVSDWHASIGKAILENWGFAQEMSDAVGEQSDHERTHKQAADLTDVLIASICLSEVLKSPAPRVIDMQGVTAFQTLGLTGNGCLAILTHAELQLGSLHETLGC